jgi:oligoribonuclease NrnB/cAMP/cGMP phosphodiesterase (DHH superfamily)
MTPAAYISIQFRSKKNAEIYIANFRIRAQWGPVDGHWRFGGTRFVYIESKKQCNL